MIKRIQGLVILLLCTASSDLLGQSLGREVNAAIQRGVRFIQERQSRDGSFRGSTSNSYPDGVTSLCLYALIKSGVYPKDLGIRRSLIALRYAPFTHTYSTALRILALDALKGTTHDATIQAAAGWLVDHFHENLHAWGYPSIGIDLSNTQYAVLGLWAAERHGFEAPEALWTRLAARVMKHQNPNGGFGYGGPSQSTGSMTTAGLAVLNLCRDRLPRSSRLAAPLKKSLGRGWAYMDRLFRPDGNPVGAYTYQKKWYYYYLYGLERACALADRDRVGGRDWYGECAQELLRLQHKDGSWGTVEDTAFTLLFLRRSTYTFMRNERVTPLEGRARGQSALRPSITVPFLHRWLLLGPFPDRDQSSLWTDIIGEAKADPRVGQTVGRRPWTEHESLEDRIDLGSVLGLQGGSIAYAFTRLFAEENTVGLLWYGGEDGSRIWLDGKLIHDHPFLEGEGADAHTLPIRLTPGPHRLLVKVANYDGDWGFSLRISTMRGLRHEGVIPSLKQEEPSLQERLRTVPPGRLYTALLDLLPRDRNPYLDFNTREELERVFISFPNLTGGARPWTWKIDQDPKVPHPNPGALGVLCVHPQDPSRPNRIFRKVRVLEERSKVMARVSACSPAYSKNADWVARFGVYDGKLHWISKSVISSGAEPSIQGWQEIAADLSAFAGKEVLLVLECAGGGPKGTWHQEYAFIDEFSLKPGKE